MILDKLIEKKDLLLYIKLRVEILKTQLVEIPKRETPQKRQLAIKQVKGRIMELKKLAFNLDKMKNMSKGMWKTLAEE